MNPTLWIATGLLAVVALVGGITKAFLPGRNWPSTTAGGSTTLNPDQAASGLAGGWVAGKGADGSRLSGRPRRLGATQAGSGT